MEQVHHIVRSLHEAGMERDTAHMVVKRIKDVAKQKQIKIRTTVKGDFVGIVVPRDGKERAVIGAIMDYYRDLYPELTIGFVQ